VFGALVAVAAPSQPPPRDNAKPQNYIPQQPTPDPRGTSQSPLVVTVQQTPKTDAETAEEQRKEDQDVSDRNWTRGLAIVTSLLGLLQLTAIGFQVRIARKQNQIIESQSTIMAGQRDAADAQSQHMREGLTHSATAANATVAAGKTARNQMYLQLRARLGLRTVEVKHFAEGSKPFVKLVFQNFGGKGAMLLEYCFIPRLGPLPKKADYPDEAWHPIGVPLEAGDSYEAYLFLPPMDADTWQQVLSSGVECHIYGAVRYLAGFGKTMTLRFCRTYEPPVSAELGEPFFGNSGGAEYNQAE
jgi:hypothetical protein